MEERELDVKKLAIFITCTLCVPLAGAAAQAGVQRFLWGEMFPFWDYNPIGWTIQIVFWLFTLVLGVWLGCEAAEMSDY